MTEQEYLDVSNLKSVRNMRSIANDTLFMDAKSRKIMQRATKNLRELEDLIFAKIESTRSREK